MIQLRGTALPQTKANIGRDSFPETDTEKQAGFDRLLMYTGEDPFSYKIVLSLAYYAKEQESLCCDHKHGF